MIFELWPMTRLYFGVRRSSLFGKLLNLAYEIRARSASSMGPGVLVCSKSRRPLSNSQSKDTTNAPQNVPSHLRSDPHNDIEGQGDGLVVEGEHITPIAPFAGLGFDDIGEGLNLLYHSRDVSG